MKKEISIEIRPHIVYVKYGVELATMNYRPDAEGLRKITFTIPVKGAYGDVIEDSGIAEVDHIDYDECTITFRSLSFYETLLMTDLITDIFKRYEMESA